MPIAIYLSPIWIVVPQQLNNQVTPVHHCTFMLKSIQHWFVLVITFLGNIQLEDGPVSFKMAWLAFLEDVTSLISSGQVVAAVPTFLQCLDTITMIWNALPVCHPTSLLPHHLHTDSPYLLICNILCHTGKNATFFLRICLIET